jgi:hypothetical protein
MHQTLRSSRAHRFVIAFVADSLRATCSRRSFAALLVCVSIATTPAITEARVGHIPRGGTVLSFASKPTSVSVEGPVIAWSKRTGCPHGLKHCYRGLVRIGSKSVAVPAVLADADIELGKGPTGKIVATYERCSPAGGCSVYFFDPAARAETQLPLTVTPGCDPTAPRIAGTAVAYIQAGRGCNAPGLYVADVSTGAVTWQAWQTGSDLEAADTDELVGNDLYWSTTLVADDAQSRTQPDRIYRGHLDSHTYAPINSGTTIADYSFNSLSVSGNKLFYLLSFSGEEQGASVSIEYRTIAGPTRRCRIKGLGTDFDPRSPRSFLLGLAAHGSYLYVVLTREDTANKDHPNLLIRYRLSSLKRICSGRGRREALAHRLRQGEHA